MGLALLLLLAFLTFGSSVLLVRGFLLPARRSVAGIGLLVFWLCNLIVPVHCLALLNLAGLISFLRVNQLLFLNGIIFACAVALYLLRPWRRQAVEPKDADKGLCQNLPLHVALGLLIVLGVYGIPSASMALGFPETWNSDAVTYHFPLALRWLLDGTMRITSNTPWQASLPGNVEVLDFLVLSSGRERLLGAVQGPGVLILVLACLDLGRRLGKSAAPAWPVATTALMIPMVAKQSVRGNVDLFGAAMLLGSLTLVLEYCDQLNGPERPRSALLITAGLGCGLAVGTKPVFWLYAVLLFLNTFFLLTLPGGRFSRRGWRRAAFFLIGMAVPSVFWFARAAWCAGNPFYPLSVHLGSLALPGFRASAITTPDYYLENVRHWAEVFVYPWTEWKRNFAPFSMSYTVDSGLGGGFATFVVPGILFAAWLARKRGPELRAWLVNLALLGILWWFLLEKVLRFGLPLLVLAVVIAAPFFEILERRATRPYKFLYVVVFAITAAILVIDPLAFIAHTLRRGDWGRIAFTRYPGIIDAFPPGSRILNLCDMDLNFALAGSHLTNRVIPIWEIPAPLTADFLRRVPIDYIVEKSTREKGAVIQADRPPVEGLELYVRESVPEGDEVADWRIWSTGRLRNDSLCPIRPSSLPRGPAQSRSGAFAPGNNARGTAR